jgi:hypothetical protein
LILENLFYKKVWQFKIVFLSLQYQNKTTMDFKSKCEKIRKLESEARKLQKEIANEIHSQLPDLFLSNGFVIDPRKEAGLIGYDQSFYDPKTNMCVVYSSVGKGSVNFGVSLRTEDGLEWVDSYYPKGDNRWRYKEESFEDFLKDTYSKKVNIINNFLKRGTTF